jgi:tetratricopeptide (TPR) repeat protein
VKQVGAWCPACFSNGKPVPAVDGLDTYLALLDLFYRRSDASAAPPLHVEGPQRVVAGSAYLGTVVPESADLYALLATTAAAKGDGQGAIANYRQAIRLDPGFPDAHYHLATLLLETGQYDEALQEFRAALRLMPESVEVRNNLGVALAAQGKLDEAIELFQQALTLEPEFPDARRNLAMALEKRRARN